VSWGSELVLVGSEQQENNKKCTREIECRSGKGGIAEQEEDKVKVED
jgi:hypothetical protein